MALPDSPLTRGEQYLAKAAGQDTALPNVPLTRVEQYLAKIAGQDVAIPDVPLTRLEQYLAAIAENSGGSSITVEPLTVTSNGTQTAPSGKAYSPVTVNVEPKIVYINVGTEGGTATLANPFDGLDYQTLMNGMAFDTAIWNAFISFQFQGMDILYHPFKAYYAITAMAFLPDDGQGKPIGAFAQWNGNGGLNALYVLSGGQLQDLSSMAANIPCKTIIYGTTALTPAD